MERQKKRGIRTKLTAVKEDLAQELSRELEGKKREGARSATGWNDPYRASGVKHSVT